MRPFFFLTTKTRRHEFFLSPFAKGGRSRGGLVDQYHGQNIQRCSQILATSNILNTEGTEDTELFVSVPSVLKKQFISNSPKCCCLSSVDMPAKAGIQWLRHLILDPRLRGDDIISAGIQYHKYKRKLGVLVSWWLKKYSHSFFVPENLTRNKAINWIKGPSHKDKPEILRVDQNGNFSGAESSAKGPWIPAFAGMTVSDVWKRGA
jgi:hypothetical protein